MLSRITSLANKNNISSSLSSIVPRRESRNSDDSRRLDEDVAGEFSQHSTSPTSTINIDNDEENKEPIHVNNNNNNNHNNLHSNHNNNNNNNNDDSTSSTSTEVEPHDRFEYEGALGSSMMLSYDTDSQFFKLNNNDALAASNALAEDFLCNISLTGATPPSEQNMRHPHFVQINAQDFLCNISLTGPMHLPRNKRQHHHHHHHRHHHHHHHHQHPLYNEHDEHDADDDAPRVSPSQRRKKRRNSSNNASPLRSNVLVDRNAVDRVLLVAKQQLTSSGAAVSRDAALDSLDSVASSASTPRQQLLATSSSSGTPLVPTLTTGADVDARAASSTDGDATHRAVLSKPIHINHPAMQQQQQQQHPHPHHHHDGDADNQSSEHTSLSDIDLRHTSERVPPPSSRRRLAGTIPHDVDTASSDLSAPHARASSPLTVGVVPSVIDANADTVAPLPPAAAAAAAAAVRQRQPTLSPPHSPVVPQPRPLAPRISITDVHAKSIVRHTPRQLYFALPTHSKAPTTVNQPASLLVVCSFVPFASRRNSAIDTHRAATSSAVPTASPMHAHNKSKKRSTTVSYANLLEPAYINARHPPQLTTKDADQAHIPNTYNATYIDDPALSTGKHRVVMHLPGLRYVVVLRIASVIKYTARDSCAVLPFVRADTLKAELDDRFRRRHPWLDEGVRLTVLRKYKRRMLDVALSVDLELSTAALGYLLLDKLILKKFCQSKADLRITAATCLVLAAKFNDPSYVDKQDYKKIMTALKSVMSVDAKTLYGAEFRAWRALEFSLFVPLHEVLPHFSRLSDHMEVIEDKYYILNANKQQPLKQSPKRSIRSGAPFKQKKNKK